MYLRGCIALDFGFVSLGLHCFLQLSHASSQLSSYKRVKGRSHTGDKQIATHPQKLLMMGPPGGGCCVSPLRRVVSVVKCGSARLCYRGQEKSTEARHRLERQYNRHSPPVYCS